MQAGSSEQHSCCRTALCYQWELPWGISGENLEDTVLNKALSCFAVVVVFIMLFTCRMSSVQWVCSEQ